MFLSWHHNLYNSVVELLAWVKKEALMFFLHNKKLAKSK